MDRRIIDFHTHAFPDALAGRAMAHLCAETDSVTAYLDGRLSSLLASMDAAGIEKSVLCSIATKPSQFEPIFEWSKAIQSERIIPLASVHPKDADLAGRVRQVADAGLAGIKMHPYYQDFDIDDPALDPLYAALQETGLLLTLHTGFDFAFAWIDRAGPGRIVNVVEKYPELRLVTTHLGSWQQWEAVEECLIGRPVYMETSFSVQYLGHEQLCRMLEAHPADYLLFGTDSPWTEQSEQVQAFRNLGISEELLEKIFFKNALKLLETLQK